MPSGFGKVATPFNLLKETREPTTVAQSTGDDTLGILITLVFLRAWSQRRGLRGHREETQQISKGIFWHAFESEELDLVVSLGIDTAWRAHDSGRIG